MLGVVLERKTIDLFPYQNIRNVAKDRGAQKLKNFGERFKDLKIYGLQPKAIDTL